MKAVYQIRATRGPSNIETNQINNRDDLDTVVVI